MTSRPVRVWMPTPGPVAYQVQSVPFTLEVISTGVDHVAPWSCEPIAQTVRLPSLAPAMMSFSRSVPRFCVVSSQIVPVRAIPRTLTGKKMEVPVKRLLLGAPLEQVASPGATLDPAALDDFARLAASWRTR